MAKVKEFHEVIEEAPSYAQAVADLASWATNYDYQTGTPFWAFLDLIGYSVDKFGAKFNPDSFELDFVSCDYLADALKEFATRPQDVTDYLDELTAAD